ncbi:MAG: DUF1599 domain-containing protein [Porphyromonas sp.]|nr:DUF1599 domain-containing protein [Porphyromonas sp.]
MDPVKTQQQYNQAVFDCRQIFEKKLHDYGAAWRILRISSLTDQLLIKARRIRSLEVKGEHRIGDGVQIEFQAIVNYCIIGLIQWQMGWTEEVDLTPQEALTKYDKVVQLAYQLMENKNHDYDEAWRQMRISSYTDLILTKLLRIKQIEDLNEKTLISEGIDANYMDILNYAIFALIRLEESSHGNE